MRPLKIGLLLDGNHVAFWQFRIIETLLNARDIHVVAAIINNSPPQHLHPLKKIWVLRSKLVWKLHEFLDERLFSVAVNANRRINIQSLLDDLKVLNVCPRQTKYCDYLDDLDVVKVRDFGLDVAIRFGFRIIQGDFLNSFKYGIWSYHHADNRINRGGPPGYWELFNSERNTGITLQILNKDLDGGLVISRALCGNQGISIYRNRNNLFLRGIPMMLEQLELLAKVGWEAFIQQKKTNSIAVYSSPLYQIPNNWRAWLNLKAVLKQGLQATLRRIFYKNQWRLLLGYKGSANGQLRKFIELRPPKHEYWADPFAIERDGALYLFFEAVPYKTYLGYLAVAVYKNNKLEKPKKVLALKHHLSFPFLLEHEGSLYMLPEASSEKQLQIYMCTTFPDVWTPFTTLLHDFSGIDTVLHFQDNMWYLFSTVQEEEGTATNEVLVLYYAENLQGPWQKHPKSPICRDVTRGRMAGRVFSQNNRWYRPAQDGTNGYGGSVNIYEIIRISPTDYEEKLISSVKPQWAPKLMKTHTWNVYDNFILADVMRLTPKYW